LSSGVIYKGWKSLKLKIHSDGLDGVGIIKY